jgi:hypothetical protein
VSLVIVLAMLFVCTPFFAMVVLALTVERDARKKAKR